MTAIKPRRRRRTVKRSNEYADFLNTKAQVSTNDGFEPTFMPERLFDFQRDLMAWAVVKGRGAIFADCGLGKTFIQLAWAQNVAEHTGGRVLVLTPLAVAAQTVEEGAKFDLEVTRSVAGEVGGAGIYVTNYERLHKFDWSRFTGVVCDESSILKNFSGKRKAAITEFMRRIKYRLLCTATASPNDYIELGTSSEALGRLGYMDMLGMFFKNDENSLHPMWRGSKWRFKPHAEGSFWRWVCSWARAIRRPSDLGFDDERFILPPLTEREHVVKCSRKGPGQLFALPAEGLLEQRQERRATIAERCAKVAELVDHDKPAVVWCHLNDEGDILEKSIPDAIQVSGKDSDENKEAKFSAFSKGNSRVMVTKPKIGSFGLNWQHCAHETFFPSHSFEAYYQSVRRCWRFGQTQEVVVDIVSSEGESGVMENLQRKAKAADVMFDSLVKHMNDAMHVNRTAYGTSNTRRPKWL